MIMKHNLAHQSNKLLLQTAEEPFAAGNPQESDFSTISLQGEMGFPASCGSLAGGSRTKLLKNSFTHRGQKVLGTQGGPGVPGAIVGKARG